MQSDITMLSFKRFRHLVLPNAYHSVLYVGGYESDSEEETPHTKDSKAQIKSEPLPLPEAMVKREATVPTQIKTEEAPLQTDRNTDVNDDSDSSNDSSD